FIMPTFSGVEAVDLVLADDEDDNLDVAEMSLTCHGFDEDRISRVNCGEDAIDNVLELQESDDVDDPVIVLLDLNMPPKMGGAEAAERIRTMMGNEELARNVMLVCCSAGRVEDLKSQSWAHNFDHFCTKPFTPQTAEELATAIEQWCEEQDE
ncbi:hypothetical protein FOZ62_029895, partial [Perkinsus olseni]